MINPSNQASSMSLNRSTSFAKQAPVNDPSHIQRLLIFHRGLPEICGGVDEGASLDELTEHVLYYHDSTSESDASSSDAMVDYATEDVVHFCGLCSALYSFPQSLDHESDECTTQVNLANATLIFCRLEGVILAVVQISHGDSLAVETSIQRCHDLFCLLRGGGVIHRLCEGTNLPVAQQKTPRKSFSQLIGRAMNDSEDEDDDMPPDISMVDDVGKNYMRKNSQHSEQASEVSSDHEKWRIEDDGCVYSGMKLLYKFRKEERKQIIKINKLSHFLELKKKSMTEELHELKTVIRKLKQMLPITLIRQELKIHYDEFIADVGTTVMNRCIVEALPAPVDKSVASTVQSTPSIVASARIGRTVEEILEHGLDKYEDDEPLLLGVSAFYHGHFIYTHLISHFPFAAESHLMGLHVTNKSACEIMSYMTAFQEKMKLADHQKVQDTGRVNVLSPLKQLHRQHSKAEESKSLEGSFLSAPPLSMLNIVDKLCDVSDPVLGHIWTPVFHLPIEAKGDLHFIEINAALFNVGSYSFLIYFDPGELDFADDISEELSAFIQHESLNYFMSESISSIHVDSPGKLITEGEAKRGRTGMLLEKMSAGLYHCIRNTKDREDPCLRSDKMPKEPGLDIIFIDRSQDKMVIKLNENRSSVDPKGIMNGLRNGLAGNFNGRSEDDFVEREAELETDVRHQLAAELPPEILHAVDDAMNEMHKVSKQAEQQSKSRVLEVKGYRHYQGDNEICIYRSEGWVWAGKKGLRELYIIFDPKIYVTISDVEKSVIQLRGAFLNDCSN